MLERRHSLASEKVAAVRPGEEDGSNGGEVVESVATQVAVQVMFETSGGTTV